MGKGLGVFLQFLAIRILNQLELVITIHLAQRYRAHVQFKGAVKLTVLEVHSLKEIHLLVVVH